MSTGLFDSPVMYLKGVGPRRAEVLKPAGVETAWDLLHYFPRRYLDRSTIVPIRSLDDAMTGTTVVGKVVAGGEVRGTKGRARYEVLLTDASGGRLKCVWFHGLKWISRQFKAGDAVAVHGKPVRYGAQFSMTHPDFDKLEQESAVLDTGRIIALYPGGAALEAAGLTSRGFRHLVHDLIKVRGLEIPELLPDRLRQEYGLLKGTVARRAIHFPKTQDELKQARRRLIFEEFFFLQLMLGLTRQTRIVEAGIRFNGRGPLMERFLNDVLPFRLTEGQQKTVADILHDTASGARMNRLIQGDVGSGKTVVAVAAMMLALDNGYQSAFMAPTEILAEQHYQVLSGYLEPMGIRTALLLGGQGRARRKDILADIEHGTASVVVGTHALIEEGVAFQRLGLAVVDEQHRFGVAQRAQMFSKGSNPHMLLMTATPIPRSLAMTLYGDLDVSVIRERPAGRKPIVTRLVSETNRTEVIGFLERQLSAGRQCYVVYPLVDESEKLDLKDAESGFVHLTELFPNHRVAMVHGRMSAAEKDAAMDQFKRGETGILVSTTVIEVGVDVPNATVMLIEHAERFGLSQLHQLRGRVGRGAEQSYCLLMADFKRTNEAEERLNAMVATDDGFKISEMDLKLRGAGDFFGTRQSGLPDLKIADIVQDQDVLTEARRAAFDLLARDPHLRDPEHEALRAYYRRYYEPRTIGYARVG